MQRGGTVYILTNKNHTVLYVGETSDLYSRMTQHIDKSFERSFTSKYNVDKLVYYTSYTTIEEAIAEEKRIKGRNRQKKIILIGSMNPLWEKSLGERSESVATLMPFFDVIWSQVWQRRIVMHPYSSLPCKQN